MGPSSGTIMVIQLKLFELQIYESINSATRSHYKIKSGLKYKSTKIHNINLLNIKNIQRTVLQL
jgi:hypothetical protein